jgi:hypothetical protein
MFSIPGLKPEKINILDKELGISDLAALEAAASSFRTWLWWRRSNSSLAHPR